MKSAVLSTYHQHVADEKRALSVTAATARFRTGLRPDVAGPDCGALGRFAATLFKQFPSKACWFDAIVTEAQMPADRSSNPPAVIRRPAE